MIGHDDFDDDDDGDDDIFDKSKMTRKRAV